MEDSNDKNSLDGKVHQLPVTASEKRRGKKEDPQKEECARPKMENHTVHTL